MELRVYSIEGNDTGRTVVVDDALFGTEPNVYGYGVDGELYSVDPRRASDLRQVTSGSAGSSRTSTLF